MVPPLMIDARTLNAGSPVIIEQRLQCPVVRCAEVPISNTARCGRDGCAEPHAAPGLAMESATAKPRREVVPVAQRRNGATARATTSGRFPRLVPSRCRARLRPLHACVPVGVWKRRQLNRCWRCRSCTVVEVLATPTFAFVATLRGRVGPTLPRRACAGQPAGRAGAAPQVGQPGTF